MLTHAIQKILKIVLVLFLAIYLGLFAFSNAKNLYTLFIGKDVGEFVYEPDFLAYYTGAQLLKENQNLYDLNLQARYFDEYRLAEIKRPGILGFINPPLLVLLFLPLTYFDPLAALQLFTTLNVGILIALSIFCAKRNLRDTLVFLGITFTSMAVKNSLANGQISILLTLALVISYIFFTKQKWFLAGFWLSLLALKVQYLPGILLATLLVREKKGFFTGTLGGLVAQLALSYAIYPAFNLSTYSKLLFNSEKLNIGTDPRYLISIQALLVKLTPNYLLFAITIILGLLLIYAAYIIVKKPQLSTAQLYLFISCSIFAFSLHSLAHDLIIPLTLSLITWKTDKEPAFTLLLHPLPLLWFFDSGITYLCMLVLSTLLLKYNHAKTIFNSFRDTWHRA